MSVKIQFRFRSLYTGSSSLKEKMDWSSIAILRRLRLKLNGFVFNPKIRYKMELDPSNCDSSSTSNFEQVDEGSGIVLDRIGNYLDADLSTVIADLMFKYKDMVMTEFAHRGAFMDVLRIDRKGYENGTGYNLHAFFVFSNNWAVSGRFAYVEPDDEVNSSVTQTSEYTFGVSHHIDEYIHKFQSKASLVNTGAENLALRIRFQVELAI